MTQTAQERKEFLKRQIDCITQYVKEDAEVDSAFYYEFMKAVSLLLLIMKQYLSHFIKH